MIKKPQMTQTKNTNYLKTTLGILFLGSLGLNAQANELHLLALSQSADATDKLPATTYKPLAILWVHEFAKGASGPVFQWTAGYIASPNQEASYYIPSNSPWGGASGRFQPSAAFVGGFRMQSRGAFRIGVGLDVRAGTEKESGNAGDVGSIQSKIKFRPWLIAQIRYAPSSGGMTPVTGLQYGVSGSDAPAPHKEFGFFVGLRF